MIKSLIPGFTCQQMPDGIYQFYVHDMKPITVDAWFDTLLKIEQDIVRDDGHLRCLYYIYGVWPTPYTIKRVLQVSRQAPQALKSSSAILLLDSHGVTVKIVQSLLRQMPAYALQVRQIFFNEVDALAWLRERDQSFI